jgi:hypothetical protein
MFPIVSLKQKATKRKKPRLRRSNGEANARQARPENKAARKGACRGQA